MKNVQSFVAELEKLRAAEADPVAGFYTPDSIIRQISQERALYLGGMRALLMQVAHPKVAQGVAEHSNFETEPLKRGMHTLRTVQTIVFGTPDEAIQAARQMYALHTRVRGALPAQSMTSQPAPYAATDPDLLLWVYATLVDSTMVTYETFLPPRTRPEWEDFYAQTRLSARFFGLAAADLPPTLNAFESYLDEMLTGDVLQVSAPALRIKQSLLSCSPLVRLLAPISYVLAAGMLPPRLRDAYGFRWDASVRLAYRAGVRLVRATLPHLPAVLRTTSAARAAQRRCQQGGNRS